jgi:peptidoglycan hydrolase-like protein with peptidoglycan-binding domain
VTIVNHYDDVVHWPIVRRGQEYPPVSTLQYLLRAHGHAIAADGIFGPRTEAAVRAFQASTGLTSDGIVGPHTWAALMVTVRRGSRGDAVRGVQQESANREGGEFPPSLAIDGIFGPATERFVLGFQDALRVSFPEDGIAVDGIVGPITWRALVSGFLNI